MSNITGKVLRGLIFHFLILARSADRPSALCPYLLVGDSMRHEVYQLARSFRVGFAQVVMVCPASVAIERNERRPPEKVCTCFSE